MVPEKLEASGSPDVNNSKILLESGEMLELGQTKELDNSNDVFMLNEPKET